MREPRERLRDILEAIANIEKYSGQGRSAFEQNELLQGWIIRNLQIIGEAARTLSPEIRDQASDVPWSKVIGMRNILVHDYFGLDLTIIWDALENDLPRLKQEIEDLLQILEKLPNA